MAILGNGVEDGAVAAMNIPRVLIIAGSDSSGGAGIQADLKTVSALGAFGMTAITALTAQNTTGVLGIVEVPPEFVALQIDACATDIGCDAVKTGMLANAEIIEAVAAKISERRLRPVVVDPVMIAKSGAPLLRPEAIAALKTALLPLATIVTPNLHEAAALLGRAINDLEGMKAAAQDIRDLGPENVVVKGGHLAGIAADVLYDGREFTEFRGERFATKNTHGTGCIFASAIAAGLAHKHPVKESVAAAKEFITEAIRQGLPLGQGCGPANPMAFWSRR
jgi:hydroxymethylpyrimidine/phosphomethylpyrimidine kinase